MCTAITYKSYFGRNLDLEYSYNESVTVTPRNFPLEFRKMPPLEHHHALIGMAYVLDNYPLYYDAINEYGLGMAGLNFPKNATYYHECPGKDNITPFEFIPWVLGQCRSVGEAKLLLSRINLLDMPYSTSLPLSPLHWMIADKEASIVVETMADGMKIYENPIGVLTNNPPFGFMLDHMTLYRDLSCRESENRLSSSISLPTYCRGIGAMGLPGDYSSPSRFVRAGFTKLNSRSEDSEEKNVSQFFHILTSVEMPRGCVMLDERTSDITIYSSCCSLERGIYYYTTYDNRQITAVDMHRENLAGYELRSYSLKKEQSISWEN